MLLFSFSPTFPSLVLKVTDTRVILQNADPTVVGSDYINGNYMKVSLQSRWPQSNKQTNKH